MNKILILHGWTYSLDKWNFFSTSLNRIGFEVELLEIPGLTLKSDEVWNLEKYSDWLDKQIGNSKVVLLGHSNGGRIAAYFTEKFPNKVQKLILIDTAGIYHKDLGIQIKRFMFGKAAQIGKVFTKNETLKKFLYRLAGESDYQKATPNMRKSMVNLISISLNEVFKRINKDTLIVWGKEDKITPLKDAYTINNSIRRSKLVIIDGARHSPFFTHTDEVVRAVTEFLK